MKHMNNKNAKKIKPEAKFKILWHRPRRDTSLSDVSLWILVHVYEFKKLVQSKSHFLFSFFFKHKKWTTYCFSRNAQKRYLMLRSRDKFPYSAAPLITSKLLKVICSGIAAIDIQFSIQKLLKTHQWPTIMHSGDKILIMMDFLCVCVCVCVCVCLFSAHSHKHHPAALIPHYSIKGIY